MVEALVKLFILADVLELCFFGPILVIFCEDL